MNHGGTATRQLCDYNKRVVTGTTAAQRHGDKCDAVTEYSFLVHGDTETAHYPITVCWPGVSVYPYDHMTGKTTFYNDSRFLSIVTIDGLSPCRQPAVPPWTNKKEPCHSGTVVSVPPCRRGSNNHPAIVSRTVSVPPCRRGFIYHWPVVDRLVFVSPCRRGSNI